MKNPFVSIIEITGSRVIGEVLLKMGALNDIDLEKALNIKKSNPNKPIQEIFVEQGFSEKKQGRPF